jgi:hypothetical protein
MPKKCRGQHLTEEGTYGNAGNESEMPVYWFPNPSRLWNGEHVCIRPESAKGPTNPQ